MREQDERGRFSKAQSNMQKSIALKFLKSGSSIEIVAENTGLTFEQVKQLQQEL